MSRGKLARMMDWEYTIQEYVRLEEHSNLKHEYLDGEIRAMGGGSLDHARVGAKVARILGVQLDGQPCDVYSSDARIRVLAANLITYPDVIVGCGPVETDVDDPYAMLNPTVVAEVTSPSSERYDRGRKLAAYKRVQSIRDIVIVSHRDRAIEVHHRQEDGTWSVASANAGERAHVPSIRCVLEVDAVYHEARSAS
ncbi:MAG: Uma2 family endonuclease [Kofleriaceae bacterium]